jgi:predicted MFS family arabinose efflux permease
MSQFILYLDFAFPELDDPNKWLKGDIASSLYTSNVYIGAFIGYSLGGYASEQFGFESCAFYFAFIRFIVLLIYFFFGGVLE